MTTTTRNIDAILADAIDDIHACLTEARELGVSASTSVRVSLEGEVTLVDHDPHSLILWSATEITRAGGADWWIGPDGQFIEVTQGGAHAGEPKLDQWERVIIRDRIAAWMAAK